ncbi:MAG: NAD(P)/FAD-dependent oxidoreductase [Clostridiales bacterium]|nr:NAD(P)/FAD-dependent oxidoreductase [Clostridiales bacterium]
MKDVIVVGGGAAGLMAAISAAYMGADVLLIERNDKCGRKLAITGKGRCNVTTASTRDEIIKNIPRGGKFMYSSLNGFDNEDVMSFFTRLGVELKVERGNRVFPVSDNARDIVNALVNEACNLGVEIKKARVKQLIVREKSVKGVILWDGTVVNAPSVIIATGGKSYPQTGSTGDGYTMAQAVGHTVTAISPSLIPLETEEEWVREVTGLSLKNTAIQVVDSTGKVLYKDFGEMLFTHYGVSGPMILSASSYVRDIKGKRIIIDLKPALDEKSLEARIMRDFEEFTNKDIKNALVKLLPSTLIPVIVSLLGVDPQKKVNQITREERLSLVRLLKNLTCTVKKTRPIEEAIITSGGISVKEIDPSTMESKLIKGLYFAGEVIDVDAYTGGFNLQIAFSTGWAAGASCLN